MYLGRVVLVLLPVGTALNVIAKRSADDHHNNMDASRFSQSEQAQLEQLLNKKQIRDMMLLYSNLVERCFTKCSTDFTSKTLSSKEEDCVKSCADKFFNLSNRVGLRFSEYHADMAAKQ